MSKIVVALVPALAAGISLALFPEVTHALSQGGPPLVDLSEGAVWACRIGGLALASILFFFAYSGAGHSE